MLHVSVLVKTSWILLAGWNGARAVALWPRESKHWCFNGHMGDSLLRNVVC